MKTLIFLAIIGFAVADPEHYDLVDLDMVKIGKDPTELKKFVDCLLDRAPCSPIYSKYRAVTPDAVQTFAAKCSPYQKHSFWQFLQALRAIYPKDYDNFRQKYDADNIYFDILETILQRYADSY